MCRGLIVDRTRVGPVEDWTQVLWGVLGYLAVGNEVGPPIGLVRVDILRFFVGLFSHFRSGVVQRQVTTIRTEAAMSGCTLGCRCVWVDGSYESST